MGYWRGIHERRIFCNGRWGPRRSHRIQMTEFIEKIVGFDERTIESRIVRDSFLLKPMRTVRSVDRWVWPSRQPTTRFSLPDVSDDGILVAITFCETPDVLKTDKEYFESLASGCSPSTVPPRMPLIGYDVCDRALLSGLLNCAYSEEEKARLQPLWEPSLNDSHLFNSVAMASRFASEAAARVPEHAPFFIFGLYGLINSFLASERQELPHG